MARQECIAVFAVNLKVTGAPDEISLSASFKYLVNPSASFLKNIPCLKVYKMLCFFINVTNFHHFETCDRID